MIAPQSEQLGASAWGLKLTATEEDPVAVMLGLPAPPGLPGLVPTPG